MPCRLIGHQVTVTTTGDDDHGGRAGHRGGAGRAPAGRARVRPASSTTTTAVPARTGRAGHRGPEPKRRRTSCALGPVAEAFLVGAAAAGVSKLADRAGRHRHPASRARHRRVAGRAAPGGGVPPLAGRRRPLHPGRRRRGADPAPGRAGAGADPAVGADPIVGGLPDRQASEPMTAAPPALAADLTAGLKRLKMAAMRRLAPELLVTAKTQRWNPEEFLRTLVEAEIAARDASNARTRRRQAAFPVTKTLDEFDLPPPRCRRPPSTTWPSLEWVRAAENVCLIGPAGTGKSHLLLALGIGRRRRRTPGPLLHRRRTRRHPLPRPGRQQRRQGHRHPAPQRPGHRRRARVRPTRRHRRPTAVPVRRRRLRTPHPSASAPTGPSSPGAGSCPNTPPPVSMLDRLLHHCHVVITNGTQSCN